MHHTININNTKMKNVRRDPIDHVITVINFYTPTSDRAKKRPQEVRDLHNNIHEITNKLKKLSTPVVLIAGDLNSKIGTSNGTERCIGK